MTIDAADVQIFLGRAFTAAEETNAPRLIEMAEAAIEDELAGFSFATGTETVDVVWHDPNVIWTPRYPVTAVHSVTVDGATVDLRTVRFNDRGKIELVDLADVWIINRPVLVGWPKVTIDYDFGLDPTPSSLAAIVASMVGALLSRLEVNPGNVLSESIGSYSVRFGPKEQAPTGTADMPVPPLPRRWKRTGVASVPLTRFR